MTPDLATVVIASGPRAGDRVELDREMTVGREEADIPIADPEASRLHAAFRPVAGGVEVVDLGSMNGTIVDGARVDAPCLAAHGSNIQIGTTSFKVELPAPDPGATRQRPIVPEDIARTAVRPKPELQPTVLGRTPAASPPPPAAAPEATPAAAAPAAPSEPPAAEPSPAGDEQPPGEAAPAEDQPPAPPAPVRAVLGFIFGAGPEKIKVRMLIFVFAWTFIVAALTVLIYTLVS